ncbi:hypothetical protein GCM10009092_44460 [Bowmanella denitrificans]|uniref:Uncharacterized protein n=1 Tax=Bowmanella denitrificans TaxID=366582 RepID=A0ABN0XWZ9_9ALTE
MKITRNSGAIGLGISFAAIMSWSVFASGFYNVVCTGVNQGADWIDGARTQSEVDALFELCLSQGGSPSIFAD